MPFQMAHLVKYFEMFEKMRSIWRPMAPFPFPGVNFVTPKLSQRHTSATDSQIFSISNWHFSTNCGSPTRASATWTNFRSLLFEPCLRHLRTKWRPDKSGCFLGFFSLWLLKKLAAPLRLLKSTSYPDFFLSRYVAVFIQKGRKFCCPTWKAFSEQKWIYFSGPIRWFLFVFVRSSRTEMPVTVTKHNSPVLL